MNVCRETKPAHKDGSRSLEVPATTVLQRSQSTCRREPAYLHQTVAAPYLDVPVYNSTKAQCLTGAQHHESNTDPSSSHIDRTYRDA